MVHLVLQVADQSAVGCLLSVRHVALHYSPVVVSESVQISTQHLYIQCAFVWSAALDRRLLFLLFIVLSSFVLFLEKSHAFVKLPEVHSQRLYLIYVCLVVAHLLHVVGARLLLELYLKLELCRVYHVREGVLDLDLERAHFLAEVGEVVVVDLVAQRLSVRLLVHLVLDPVLEPEREAKLGRFESRGRART